MILRPFQSCSFLFLFLLLGCSAPETNPDGTKKDTRILPPSSGTHSELLLVMPDELWIGPAGEAFRELYLADQRAFLNQKPILTLHAWNPKR